MSKKEYMPAEDIKKYVLSNYPYEIYDVTQIKFKDTDKQRAVYKFESSNGPKCLKKVYFDEENLLFIYSVIEWLYRHGINLPRLLPTKTGGKYVKYNNNLFIVTDWIEGRKCDYDNDMDVAMAAKNLGKMHISTYNFTPIEGSLIRREDYNWYKTFNRRYSQLMKFYNKALIQNDKFSKLFIESFDYYFERAKNAVYYLSCIDNKNLTSPVDKYNTICHLDYVNKNIIITDYNDLYVIDFDKCKVDIPIHDLGTFLKRILKRKKTCWSFDILLMVLENYEKERKLTISENIGLLAYLEFPQKYWKVSRDYYNNRKKYDKDVLIKMLKDINNQQKKHSIFCDNFKAYIEEKFNISLG